MEDHRGSPTTKRIHIQSVNGYLGEMSEESPDLKKLLVEHLREIAKECGIGEEEGHQAHVKGPGVPSLSIGQAWKGTSEGEWIYEPRNSDHLGELRSNEATLLMSIDQKEPFEIQILERDCAQHIHVREIQ